MNSVKIFLIPVLFLFVLSLSAQEHSLTVVGGLNGASMSVKYGSSTANIEDSYKLKMIFHGGALLNYVLSKDRNKELSIEPGIIFDGKGYKQELDIGDYQWDIYYVDIPVYFRYSKKLRSRDKIYGGVGPYIGVGLFGTKESSYNVEGVEGGSSEKIKWGNDSSKDDVKRFDYGVGARIGYQSYGGLNISTSYDFGLPNVAAADNPEFKHRVFRVSVGYSFSFDD